jgi:hypothetical protein
MFDVNAGNSPEIPSFSLKGNFQGLNYAIDTFPPLIEYSFSMLVKVNLTPGSLSLMAISKWIQKYFSGDAKNST